MITFIQKVINSKSFTRLLAAFVLWQADNSNHKWHPAAEKATQDTETRLGPTVPPFLRKPTSRDHLPGPTHLKLEEAHSRKHNHKSRQKVSNNHTMPVFTSFHFSNPYPFNSVLVADHKFQQKEQHQELRDFMKPKFLVLPIVKLIHICAVAYHIYRLGERFPSYNEWMSF